MKDYTKLANKAATLVQKYGRAITAVKFDKVEANPSKPWEGAADVRDTAVETSCNGVAVSIADGIRLGVTVKDSMMAKDSEQIFIVALGASSAVDLSQYNEVIDQSTRWRVTKVEKLQPATMILLYFVGVKR